MTANAGANDTSNVQVSGPPVGGPPTMSRAARARAIRQRLRHPPNAVIDDGIDFKRKEIIVTPTPPSEARGRRGDFSNSPELTVGEVLSLDQQINALIAELDRLCARRDQQYEKMLHRRPATQTIQRVVARHYRVRLVDILSARRTKAATFARQVAIYLVRQHTLLSLPAIGRLFGNRDHTTILHAARKIKAMREVDPALSDTLDALTAVIATAPVA